MGRVHIVDRFTTPPHVHDLEALSREAFATIPQELRRVLGDVVIQVVEFPDEETMEELDCETPFDLLGLYRGVDMLQKSTLNIADSPDMIFLYRRPILDYWCETGEDIAQVIRNVLIHEIGHHFGFSDDDMDRIEHEI
jgi:predicted Zn-dependent protease with MMP-like domain